MKRIAFVGSVGAGKQRYLMRCRELYPRQKNQAVEFNDKGDIDTPGESVRHPRWYHALITTLQDVDMLIYVHGANDPESRLPAGLLDIGVAANGKSPSSVKRTCQMLTSPQRESYCLRRVSKSRFSS
ncbi:EutP/PduV family microcompartment system protein [Escherichia coli]